MSCSKALAEYPEEERLYQSTVRLIKESEEKCQPILPLPRDVKLKAMQDVPKAVPATFQLKGDYDTKLKESKCVAVYPRVNTKMMSTSLEQHKAFPPLFRVAPSNSKITFFNHIKSFQIQQTDLDNVLEQAKRLPSYFNWTEQSAEICKPYDQGLCGSCWAVAAANCMSDVFVVSKKVKENPKISPTYFLSCLPQYKCDGGDPSQALNDMVNQGVATDDCLDYSWCTNSACGGDATKHFEDHDVNKYVPKCACAKPAPEYLRYFAEEPQAICIPPVLSDFNSMERANIGYYLQGMYGLTGTGYANLAKYSYKDIQALIKNHIYNHGPVIGGFHVFKNFFKGRFTSTNGIYIETATYGGVPGVDYSDVESDWSGSHAVVIVGWGTDQIDNEKVDYWIVRNSWGESWGNSGFWKMGMYGNEKGKKYQNRFSQFEYPSIVMTSQGIALTGGVLLFKAGRVEPFKQAAVQAITSTTPAPGEQMNVLSVVTLIGFLYALYLLYSQQPRKDTSIQLAGKTVALIIVAGWLFSFDPALQQRFFRRK